jgi:hypothetical protein
MAALRDGGAAGRTAACERIGDEAAGHREALHNLGEDRLALLPGVEGLVALARPGRDHRPAFIDLGRYHVGPPLSNLANRRLLIDQDRLEALEHPNMGHAVVAPARRRDDVLPSVCEVLAETVADLQQEGVARHDEAPAAPA